MSNQPKFPVGTRVRIVKGIASNIFVGFEGKIVAYNWYREWGFNTAAVFDDNEWTNKPLWFADDELEEIK